MKKFIILLAVLPLLVVGQTFTTGENSLVVKENVADIKICNKTVKSAVSLFISSIKAGDIKDAGVLWIVTDIQSGYSTHESGCVNYSVVWDRESRMYVLYGDNTEELSTTRLSDVKARLKELIDYVLKYE